MSVEGLVSAVVPTKDRPAMLRRAVRSVREQTYEPIELIVVDDGSEEPAREAIADLQDGTLERFVIRRQATNRGAAAARNVGIETARGEYVAFLDDDDQWEPRKTERQVAALAAADEDAGVTFVGNRQIDADGTTVDTHVRDTDGDISAEILYGNYIGSFSGVLVERDLVDAVGGLDERFPAWQDWELYVQLAQRAEFVAVPEPLARRSVEHGGRISPGYDAKREIAPVLFEDYLREPAAAHGVERRVRGSLQARLGRAAWLEGRFPEARRHYAHAIGTYPLETSFWVFLLAVSGGPYTMHVAKQAKRLLESLPSVDEIRGNNLS